jgi:hypothetical protein
LNVEGFIPMMVDSLLLDLEHPRRAQPDFDVVAPPVQQDFAEAIAQVAMFTRGREALLQDPSVVEALQQVAVEGLTDEAKLYAQSALLAMSDRQPEAGHGQHADADKHVMLSCKHTSKLLVIRAHSDNALILGRRGNSDSAVACGCRPVGRPGGGQAHRVRAAGAGLPHVVRCVRTSATHAAN